MLILNIIAYVGLIATTITQLCIDDPGAAFTVLCAWWIAFTTFMSVLLTYAIFKIRGYSKKLASKGLLANEKLMAFHVISFVTASILNSIKNFLAIFCEIFKTTQVDKLVQLRYEFAYEIMNLLENPFWTFLNMTMLVLFFKYSAPLSSDETSSCKRKFLLVFNASEEGFKAIGDQQTYQLEVEKAERKRKIYSEMADK